MLACMVIREARAADWAAIWPILKEVGEAGETLTWDPRITEARARAAGCANCRAEQLSPSMVMDVSSGARTLIPTTLGRALMSPTRDSLSTRPGGRRAWDGPFAVMFSTRRVRTVTGRCSSIRWSKPILPRFACGALSAFRSLPLCQRGFVIQRMDTLAFILCIGRFETERRTFISAEAEIAVQPSVCPAVRLSASQATAWAGVGRLARAGFRSLPDRMHAGGRICNLA